ncbi:hypothetical protein [Pseudodesulfovibrio sp. zrk46]|uniref:hypothetical protein n=1 Tax=Pseudodesulfovibrio sp. zrk46 TaxID=2725288 RepID=UPI001449B48D|nr:hypothetical protein [Pseudodesulfovibrio sp. zrk46]QJB56409.1 hypothetical protein HFN16_08270 [Pseudodesulfovibrio sp. zrk46]
MKRLIISIVTLMLAMPGFAFAYTIQPIVDTAYQTQISWSEQSTQSILSMSTGAVDEFRVNGAFRVISDRDPNAIEDVTVSLSSSMTLSAFGFAPGSVPAPQSASANYNIDISYQDEAKLTDSYSLDTIALPGIINSSKIINVFNLNLLTNTIYSFLFSGDVSQLNSIAINNWETTLHVTSSEMSPTPVPGAFLLLGSGLIGLVGIRRRMQG